MIPLILLQTNYKSVLWLYLFCAIFLKNITIYSNIVQWIFKWIYKNLARWTSYVTNITHNLCFEEINCIQITYIIKFCKFLICNFSFLFNKKKTIFYLHRSISKIQILFLNQIVLSRIFSFFLFNAYPTNLSAWIQPRDSKYTKALMNDGMLSPTFSNFCKRISPHYLPTVN